MTDEEKLVQEAITEEAGQDGANGDRVAELERLLALKDEELARTKGRVAELEQATVASEKKVGELTASLKKAVSDYRILVVQSQPDIPEEMITGDSIESIGASLKSARELVGKIRANMEAGSALTRVPAGAPQRTAEDLSAMSPREKINRGIEKVKN